MPDNLPVEAQLRIDEICDAFEERWRQGDQPRAEEFLGEHPAPLRSPLFAALLSVEVAWRQRRLQDDASQRPTRKLLDASDPESTLPLSEGSLGSDRFPSIPGYEIGSILGKGGMGIVYRARHRATNRLVALKMIFSERKAGEEQRRRFQLEAEVTAALDHPNIVPIYEVGEASGQSYMTVKLLPGGNLAERIQRQPCSHEDAAWLVATIALAVQHAHDRGILHRDLKPSNILLDGETPYVADFGLAHRLEADLSLTPTGSPLGTLGYMAPEQARGERDITVQADVYSLGAILFKLLTGSAPHVGNTTAEVLMSHLADQPVPLARTLNPAVPVDLETICRRCLEREPRFRYGSARALAEDLQRFLEGQSLSDQPEGFWDWLAQLWRTRPNPGPEYTWMAPIWLGAILFLQQASVNVILWTDQPAWVLWCVLLVGWVGMVVALWEFLLRRFREVPVTERHSVVIAIGSILAQMVLFLAIGPLSPQVSSRAALPWYMPALLLSGLGIFVLGSTNWGRFLPVGLGVMLLALMPAFWPETGPPLFAIVVPLCLVWWGPAKWREFVRPHRRPAGQ